jgi:mRNA-degrading endonuclease RelE of RelBE toxin-antitoxin system
MPAFRETRRLPEFEGDLKKLRKRFRTLDEDLATLMIAQIALYHKQGVDSKGIFRISGLPFTDPEVYKVRKFACKSLKGRGASSGLRLIYAYFRTEDRVEMVEIYFKGDKENENRERIVDYYGKGIMGGT